MFNAALFSIVEEAGIAVLTLTEGLDRDELLRSRLTRLETQHQLKVMCDTLASVPPQTQALLPEVDWPGWSTIARRLEANNGEAQDALWFAVRSLVPATLMWLRVYHKDQPDIFEFRPTSSIDGANS